MPDIEPSPAREAQTTTGAVVKRLSQIVVLLAIFAASLFLSSGQLDWVMGWAYLGMYVGMIVATGLVIDRDLIAERARVGEGTKDWDRVLGSLSIFLVAPGALIVAGLDERFGWSQIASIDSPSARILPQSRTKSQFPLLLA